MGLIRTVLNRETLGAVSRDSRKQRVASQQLSGNACLARDSSTAQGGL